MVAAGIDTPGIFLLIHSACLADRNGPPPTRINTFSWSPISTTWVINVCKRCISKQNWVWMKFAPASIFFFSRIGRKSSGGTNGLLAAPRNKFGGGSICLPLRNCPLSRRILAVRSKVIESRAKTGFVSGWSPVPTPSPVRQSTFRIPNAAIPSNSPCKAIRLRSRHDNWATTSYPACLKVAATATLDIWTFAPDASVALIASTECPNKRAFSKTAWGSDPSGGSTSAVTAKCPASSTRSNLEFDFIQSSRVEMSWHHLENH